MRGFQPTDVGWRLGAAHEPRGGQLWVPWDRTAGVIGPQGSGKTLDLLIPALLAAPGAALVTLTKTDDLLLSIDERSSGGRPVAVLDPFGLAPGVPELVWDPIAGCVDPMVAERRAKAFTAGTVSGAGARGQGEDAARFYAAEAAKVIQAYFHAAALTGRTLQHVLRWVANPVAAVEPTEILREHPHAAPFWHGLLHGALRGDDRTAGNTITTVQQALSLFFQEQIRRRCVPGPGRPATNIADLIDAGGTIYLLGRESPYESASPLMTAVAEHVLDTALAAAQRSQWGRLCPPMLACLDELPSTAPLPTLQTRMANERALGISFIWAAQTRAQLTQIFGDHEARAVLGLTNTLVMFGGSKDVAFNQEISDLLGPVRVARTTWQTGRTGRSVTGEDIPILTGAEIRQLPERRALVVAEHGKPIIATLTRCIDGRRGRRLLANQSPSQSPDDRRAGPPGTTPMPEPPRPSSKPTDTACAPTSERERHDRRARRRTQPPGRWSSPSHSPGGSSSTPTGNSPWQPTAPRNRSAPSATYAPRQTLGPTHLHPPRPPARALGVARRRRHLDQPRIRLGHSLVHPQLLARTPTPRPRPRGPRRPTPASRPSPHQRRPRRLAPIRAARVPRSDDLPA